MTCLSPFCPHLSLDKATLLLRCGLHGGGGEGAGAEDVGEGEVWRG